MLWNSFPLKCLQEFLAVPFKNLKTFKSSYRFQGYPNLLFSRFVYLCKTITADSSQLHCVQGNAGSILRKLKINMLQSKTTVIAGWLLSPWSLHSVSVYISAATRHHMVSFGGLKIKKSCCTALEQFQGGTYCCALSIAAAQKCFWYIQTFLNQELQSFWIYADIYLLQMDNFESEECGQCLAEIINLWIRT